MEGYVWKKRPQGVRGLKVWQKRWMELLPTAVVYYKKKGGKEARGVISLDEIEHVVLLDRPENPVRFDIQGKGELRKHKTHVRVFAFRTATPREASMWVDAIRDHKYGNPEYLERVESPDGAVLLPEPRSGKRSPIGSPTKSGLRTLRPNVNGMVVNTSAIASSGPIAGKTGRSASAANSGPSTARDNRLRVGSSDESGDESHASQSASARSSIGEGPITRSHHHSTSYAPHSPTSPLPRKEPLSPGSKAKAQIPPPKDFSRAPEDTKMSNLQRLVTSKFLRVILTSTAPVSDYEMADKSDLGDVHPGSKFTLKDIPNTTAQLLSLVRERKNQLESSIFAITLEGIKVQITRNFSTDKRVLLYILVHLNRLLNPPAGNDLADEDSPGVPASAGGGFHHVGAGKKGHRHQLTFSVLPTITSPSDLGLKTGEATGNPGMTVTTSGLQGSSASTEIAAAGAPQSQAQHQQQALGRLHPPPKLNLGRRRSVHDDNEAGGATNCRRRNTFSVPRASPSRGKNTEGLFRSKTVGGLQRCAVRFCTNYVPQGTGHGNHDGGCVNGVCQQCPGGQCSIQACLYCIDHQHFAILIDNESSIIGARVVTALFPLTFPPLPPGCNASAYFRSHVTGNHGAWEHTHPSFSPDPDLANFLVEVLKTGKQSARGLALRLLWLALRPLATHSHARAAIEIPTFDAVQLQRGDIRRSGSDLLGPVRVGQSVDKPPSPRAKASGMKTEMNPISPQRSPVGSNRAPINNPTPVGGKLRPHANSLSTTNSDMDGDPRGRVGSEDSRAHKSSSSSLSSRPSMGSGTGTGAGGAGAGAGAGPGAGTTSNLLMNRGTSNSGSEPATHSQSNNVPGATGGIGGTLDSAAAIQANLALVDNQFAAITAMFASGRRFNSQVKNSLLSMLMSSEGEFTSTIGGEADDILIAISSLTLPNNNNNNNNGPNGALSSSSTLPVPGQTRTATGRSGSTSGALPTTALAQTGAGGMGLGLSFGLMGTQGAGTMPGHTLRHSRSSIGFSLNALLLQPPTSSAASAAGGTSGPNFTFSLAGAGTGLSSRGGKRSKYGDADVDDGYSVVPKSAVRQPGIWEALFLSLQGSDFGIRQRTLRDVNVVLMDNPANCLSLLKHPQWAHWVFEMLTDIPSRVVHALHPPVSPTNAPDSPSMTMANMLGTYRYCMHTVNIIHHECFFVLPQRQFRSMLQNCFDHLLQFSGDTPRAETKCRDFIRQTLLALVKKLVFSKNRFPATNYNPHDDRAYAWANLGVLIDFVKIFLFCSVTFPVEFPTDIGKVKQKVSYGARLSAKLRGSFFKRNSPNSISSSASASASASSRDSAGSSSASGVAGSGTGASRSRARERRGRDGKEQKERSDDEYDSSGTESSSNSQLRSNPLKSNPLRSNPLTSTGSRGMKLSSRVPRPTEQQEQRDQGREQDHEHEHKPDLSRNLSNTSVGSTSSSSSSSRYTGAAKAHAHALKHTFRAHTHVSEEEDASNDEEDEDEDGMVLDKGSHSRGRGRDWRSGHDPAGTVAVPPLNPAKPVHSVGIDLSAAFHVPDTLSHPVSRQTSASNSSTNNPNGTGSTHGTAAGPNHGSNHGASNHSPAGSNNSPASRVSALSIALAKRPPNPGVDHEHGERAESNEYSANQRPMLTGEAQGEGDREHRRSLQMLSAVASAVNPLGSSHRQGSKNNVSKTHSSNNSKNNSLHNSPTALANYAASRNGANTALNSSPNSQTGSPLTGTASLGESNQRKGSAFQKFKGMLSLGSSSNSSGNTNTANGPSSHSNVSNISVAASHAHVFSGTSTNSPHGGQGSKWSSLGGHHSRSNSLIQSIPHDKSHSNSSNQGLNPRVEAVFRPLALKMNGSAFPQTVPDGHIQGLHSIDTHAIRSASLKSSPSSSRENSPQRKPVSESSSAPLAQTALSETTTSFGKPSFKSLNKHGEVPPSVTGPVTVTRRKRIRRFDAGLGTKLGWTGGWSDIEHIYSGYPISNSMSPGVNSTLAPHSGNTSGATSPVGSRPFTFSFIGTSSGPTSTSGASSPQSNTHQIVPPTMPAPGHGYSHSLNSVQAQPHPTHTTTLSLGSLQPPAPGLVPSMSPGGTVPTAFTAEELGCVGLHGPFAELSSDCHLVTSMLGLLVALGITGEYIENPHTRPNLSAADKQFMLLASHTYLFLKDCHALFTTLAPALEGAQFDEGLKERARSRAARYSGSSSRPQTGVHSGDQRIVSSSSAIDHSDIISASNNSDVDPASSSNKSGFSPALFFRKTVPKQQSQQAEHPQQKPQTTPPRQKKKGSLSYSSSLQKTTVPYSPNPLLAQAGALSSPEQTHPVHEIPQKLLIKFLSSKPPQRVAILANLRKELAGKTPQPVKSVTNSNTNNGRRQEVVLEGKEGEEEDGGHDNTNRRRKYTL